ncbi:response regulator transcription factor [Cohnella herbarum]|uniref:Response regulator n=1 Tax=Cohnella herbarum TaxID=2728023 RepID=A0A7Z2ZM57_9BACL|nr:response regulator [Cohnella herbarum]QJD84515.1 response regulator [Cohnella herbarum]
MNRVLIVDNSPLIRNSLSKQVEESGDHYWLAGTAANGMLALEWLEQNYADICITDVRMPVMDGIELLRQIRAKYPWMVCIMVSSYDEFAYAKESIQLEAIDYILKPVDRDLLYSTLAKSSAKLQDARYNEAYKLLLKYLPSHRDILARWMNELKLARRENIPLLIVDMLDILTKWTEGKYYLLNGLAMAWLNLLAEEMKLENLEITLFEGKDYAIGESVLSADKVRYYYRVCAVRRLEEGAEKFLDRVTEALTQPNRKVVEQIKQLLRKHYMEKIDYQLLASSVMLSRNYMSDLFKQETGMTMGQYAVYLRMEEAKRLLQDTSLKTYEVAHQVGYEDYIHFAKVYKKYCEFSPMEYRKRLGI